MQWKYYFWFRVKCSDDALSLEYFYAEQITDHETLRRIRSELKQALVIAKFFLFRIVKKTMDHGR